MTDIVERLRELAHEYHQHRPHYTEAAAEIERLHAECAHVYSEYDLVITQRDQLLAALNLVMVGGNHIATYRTDRWPSYGTEPADALEKLGAGQEYDMWCCWAAIMTARAVERRP